MTGVRSALRVRAGPPAICGATVSVIIPCYNYGRFLAEAVFSALEQDKVGVNVIIVDDASTDDSAAIALGIAAADERVTVIRHEVNEGPVQTFNDGLAVAGGEFLVRLDADDLLAPGALVRAAAVMRAFPSVGLVYGHPLHFAGRPPVARTDATRWTIWPGREWLAERCRTGLNVITSLEVMMRRHVVDQVGGQRALAHTHDMEMWLRISAVSDVAYIHGADQAWHREHPASLSARRVDALRDLEERRDAFALLFDGNRLSIAGGEELHLLARVALACDAVELASRQFDRPLADIQLVQRLEAIARGLVAEVDTVPGWEGLRRRKAMGAGRASRHPSFFAERVVRGLFGRYRRLRWHRAGV